MEVMNMILLSIPNEIYNSVDACTSAKDMWKRVERLMRGTIQNKVDRETRFTNEFDQFVAEPGEALVSVYNRFAQLMNDLERNNMNFPSVTINTKVILQLFNATTAVKNDIMLGIVQSQGIIKDKKRNIKRHKRFSIKHSVTKRKKYLDDILQLRAKIEDLENVVCKIGKSTETLRLLTNEQKAFQDNLHKSGLGYNCPCVLLQAYAKIPKLYRAYELCDKNEQLHVFDSEETLEDAEKSQLKLNEFQKIKSSRVKWENDLDETFKQNELLKDRLLEASLAEDIKNLVITSCVEIRNKDLHDEIKRIFKRVKKMFKRE
ncbi:hypothetical protein Tco_0088502 [Tanacetum coccineum]